MTSTLSARKSFMNYLKAFNESNFQQFASFYSDDIIIYLNPTVQIVGPQAAKKFFGEQREKIGEHLTIEHLIIDEGGCAIRCHAQFTALTDLPDGYFRMPPIKKGQGYDVDYMIMYNFNDQGQISAIRAVRQASPTVREA